MRGPAAVARFDSDFAALAHRHQEPPAFANSGGAWTTWLVLGGRGAGKTRLGAEWVRALAHGTPPYAERRSPPHRARRRDRSRRARGDDRGRLGHPAHVRRARERPVWIATAPAAGMGNGAVAQAFSAEDPDGLRGPQFDAAWCDELAKWRYAEAAFDMLQFGLRLGARPRQLITTTPRPIPLIKRLIADPRTAVTRAATQANAAILSPAFLDEVLARYAGTRLGRQEIDGEIIEDRPGRAVVARHDRSVPRRAPRRRLCASWSGSIRRHRRAGATPAASSRRAAPRTASSMCWRTRTVRGLPPAGWATQGDRALSQAEGRQAGGRGEPGRRHGARGAAPGRCRGAAADACTPRAANGCAPSRSRRCTRRAASSTSNRRCGAGGPDVRLRPGRALRRRARPTGSTRWCGRSPR